MYISITNYQQKIVRNPQIYGGESVIKGTRVTIRTILASLGEGASIEEILDEFPTIKEENVKAVIAFAAQSAADDHPFPRAPFVS